MVSALGLAGKATQKEKKKEHRGPQAGPAKEEKKKQIDKKKRGVDGGKEKNPKVSSSTVITQTVVDAN